MVSEQAETTESNVESNQSLLTQHKHRRRLCARCSKAILDLDVIFGRQPTAAATAAGAADSATADVPMAASGAETAATGVVPATASVAAASHILRTVGRC